MAEHVILFAGPMGAGKTTAIRTLSDIEVVSTEAANSERNVVDKPTTTVALDYGEITLGDEEKIRLYGVPGQERFDFMWTILAERAVGLVLLVNNDAPDPIALTLSFAEKFNDLIERGGAIIGVSRSDLSPRPATRDYARALAAAYPDRMIPVFTLDPRDLSQMRTVLVSLVATIESRSPALEPEMNRS
jgi:signal recognition particle receptor subunit beta